LIKLFTESFIYRIGSLAVRFIGTILLYRALSEEEISHFILIISWASIPYTLVGQLFKLEAQASGFRLNLRSMFSGVGVYFIASIVLWGFSSLELHYFLIFFILVLNSQFVSLAQGYFKPKIITLLDNVLSPLLLLSLISYTLLFSMKLSFDLVILMMIIGHTLNLLLSFSLWYSRYKLEVNYDLRFAQVGFLFNVILIFLISLVGRLDLLILGSERGSDLNSYYMVQRLAELSLVGGEVYLSLNVYFMSGGVRERLSFKLIYHLIILLAINFGFGLLIGILFYLINDKFDLFDFQISYYLIFLAVFAIGSCVSFILNLNSFSNKNNLMIIAYIVVLVFALLLSSFISILWLFIFIQIVPLLLYLLLIKFGPKIRCLSIG